MGHTVGFIPQIPGVSAEAVGLAVGPPVHVFVQQILIEHLLHTRPCPGTGKEAVNKTDLVPALIEQTISKYIIWSKGTEVGD